MSLAEYGHLVPGTPVDLPGGTSYYRRLNGPPGAPVVVLVHGWTATAAINWQAAMEPLSKHFTVIAMDVRGHGRGIRTDAPFRLEDAADDVADLLDHLHIPSAIIAGYSMGGPIAQLTWKRHPDKVRGLVLASTSGGFPEILPVASPLHWLDRILHLIPRGERRTLLPFADRDAYHRIPVLDEMGRADPRMLVEAGDALAGYNAWPWLPSINVPTAIVETTRDLLVEPALQERMARLIPHSRTYRVNSVTGHVVAGLDPKEWVKQLVAATRDVDLAARTQSLHAPHAGQGLSLAS